MPSFRDSARGTTAPGARDQHEAAQWVRAMFGRVAPRYDLLNHVLSMNVDRWWRARTVRRVRQMLQKPGARAMDLCCGTGDLALALASAGPANVIGSDFSYPMLAEARRKAEKKRARCSLVEADALRLPVGDGSLDVVTVAFGFRNLTDYRAGLDEMLRVLRGGGMAAILEFSQPENRVLAALYGFYSRRVLPAVGGLVSGERGAYEYLPESVRKFPSAPDLARQMHEAGFSGVEYELLTGGIAALHLGVKR